MKEISANFVYVLNARPFSVWIQKLLDKILTFLTQTHPSNSIGISIELSSRPDNLRSWLGWRDCLRSWLGWRDCLRSWLGWTDCLRSWLGWRDCLRLLNKSSLFRTSEACFDSSESISFSGCVSSMFKYNLRTNVSIRQCITIILEIYKNNNMAPLAKQSLSQHKN